MELQIEKFGFYKIDKEYLKFLHSKDEQVFYEDTKEYERKPHLGIIVGINEMKYCIPLTSAKARHLNWANVSEHNIIIYEMVKQADIHKKDICKRINNTNTYKKIISVLEIRKMIPINDNLYTYIDFSAEKDLSYKDLLEKEYRFLKPLKDTILKKAKDLYMKQKETEVIKLCYCNFNILEKAYYEYCSMKNIKAD